MSEELQFAFGIAYASPGPDITTLLRTLHGVCATTVGRYSPRVPFEIALEQPPIFAYANAASAASDHGWRATIYLGPYMGVSLVWPEAKGGTWHKLDAVYERLLAVRAVDYAAADCVVVRKGDGNPSRAALLAYFDADRYARLGPVTLGARTVLGPRVLDLLETDIREDLVAAGRVDSRGLNLGDSAWFTTDDGRARRESLAARFETSSIVQRISVNRAGIGVGAPAPGWVPLAAGRPPETPRGMVTAVKKLRAGKGDLDLSGLFAPFAELNEIDVSDVDLETQGCLYRCSRGPS